MFKIRTYNQISSLGLDRFSRDSYEVGADVDAPEAFILRSQKLHTETVPDSLLAVADAIPWRLSSEKVPAECICSISIQDLGRLFVVPLAFGHLATVLAEHMTENDAISERVWVVFGWHRCRGVCRCSVSR